MALSKQEKKFLMFFLLYLVIMVTLWFNMNPESQHFSRHWLSAQLGNANSQFEMGNCYYNATAVEQDYEKAAYWYARAAENGHTGGMNNLANQYVSGLGVAQDLEKAFAWYSQGAQAGNEYCQLNLGKAYEHGLGVQVDYCLAREWYRKAAAKALAHAQYALGIFAENDYCDQQADEDALYWYEQSAAQGHVEAQFNLAGMYFKRGGELDYQRAVQWYELAAQGGYAAAQHNLGLMIQKGQGVAADAGRSFAWLLKAAEQGHAPAQNMVGGRFQLGDGVAADLDQAIFWYEKARAQGNVDGCMNLLNIYTNSRPDHQQVTTLLKEAAGLGDPEAQRRLARQYIEGEGAEENLEEALSLIQKAAEQEYGLAQFDLGLMYFVGFIVKQDYCTALPWFQKAYDQQVVDSLAYIGWYHEQGQCGVGRSMKKAKEYYQRSGSAWGKKQLARLAGS